MLYPGLKSIQKNVDYKIFLENNLVQDGVIRQIEIIGEATKRLSGKIREKYPKVSWKDIPEVRDN